MSELTCAKCGDTIPHHTTKRQERLARELLSGKHKTIKDAVLASGYSEGTAISPYSVTQSPTVKREMERIVSNSAKGGSVTDKAKTIQRQAMDILSTNVGSIRDANPREAIQLAGGTLKVTSDYLKDAPDDTARADISDVRALAIRLVLGGIKLGSALGGECSNTVARYVKKLKGTRYEVAPTPRLRARQVEGELVSVNISGQVSEGKANGGE